MKQEECCKQTVYKVANMNNIRITGSDVRKAIIKRKNGNDLQVYDSVSDAAKDIKITDALQADVETIRKNISRCANDPARTSAYDYEWKYCNY